MVLKPPHRQKGSALIMVFWCLILIGMAVFGVIELVELSAKSTSHHERLMEARALAATGVALGCNAQILKDDPLLSQKLDGGGQFKVFVESEGARLNLNYVLLSGHREILVNLFTQWGMPIADADRVADCLYDWVTPGDLRSLDGAKGDDYAKAGLKQRPSGQAFTSFAEVEQVMGMDMVEKVNSNWKDSFTLWSVGPLNVSEAPADLIAAVFSLDPKRVKTFVQRRNGKDGLAGTDDDLKVSDLQTFQANLGIDDLIMKTMGPQISFDDSIRHVKSVGQVAGATVTISVVTKLSSSPVQYLSWTEE